VSELVTGEAVVLELRLARPATRALALGIDLTIEALIFLALLFPIGAVIGDRLSESLITALILIGLVGTFVGYNTVLETLTRGKTVGKYALGLRVVRDDGGPVRFRHAFVRAMAGFVVDFFGTSGVVGFTTAMLSKRGKRVGDMLAGTVVVRERAPAAADPLPAIPPPLVSWAALAELSRVPDDLALSARSFLSRYADLEPSAREALGGRLAATMAQYVSPPPPPGTPAWAYLAAVLGERSRRAFNRPGHGQQQAQPQPQPMQHPTWQPQQPPQAPQRPASPQTPPQPPDDGGFAAPR
jgi:uncharacterized RDD family membrane protein YckC